MSHFDLAPDLLREAGQLAAEASVIAEGQTTAWDISGGRGVPSSNPPAGQSWSLHDAIVARVRRCSTDTHLREAIAWAREAVDATRTQHKRNPRESKEERDHRILTDDVGKTAADVARMEGVGPQVIERLRRNNGRNPDDGRRVRRSDMSKASAEERREVIAELDAEGLSGRQIALSIKVDWNIVRADIAAIRSKLAKRLAA
jgi:hypothetical protein